MLNRETFKLSIIIPCYNEKNTIENILKRIDQSLKDNKFSKFEIIIVDDFSNDGTKEILNNFKKIQLSLDFKKKKSQFIIKNNFKKNSVKIRVKEIIENLI